MSKVLSLKALNTAKAFVDWTEYRMFVRLRKWTLTEAKHINLRLRGNTVNSVYCLPTKPANKTTLKSHIEKNISQNLSGLLCFVTEIFYPVLENSNEKGCTVLIGRTKPKTRMFSSLGEE